MKLLSLFSFIACIQYLNCILKLGSINAVHVHSFFVSHMVHTTDDWHLSSVRVNKQKMLICNINGNKSFQVLFNHWIRTKHTSTHFQMTDACSNFIRIAAPFYSTIFIGRCSRHWYKSPPFVFNSGNPAGKKFNAFISKNISIQTPSQPNSSDVKILICHQILLNKYFRKRITKPFRLVRWDFEKNCENVPFFNKNTANHFAELEKNENSAKPQEHFEYSVKF